MLDFDALNHALRDEALDWLADQLQDPADQTLDVFMSSYADAADCPGVGIEIAQVLTTVLGPSSTTRHDGDLTITHPVIIHGDLVVEGQLDITAHVIITGDTSATTISTGYDGRVTVLGDVDCQMLFTDGALYVHGSIRAARVLWAFGSGWTLGAAAAATALYLNTHDHPVEFGELVAARSFIVSRAVRGELGLLLPPTVFNSNGELSVTALLEAVARGESLAWERPERLTQSDSAHVTNALKRHIDAWPSSRRELLGDLRENWLEALASLQPEDHAVVIKYLKKKVRSPRLEALRAELLRDIDAARTSR